MGVTANEGGRFTQVPFTRHRFRPVRTAAGAPPAQVYRLSRKEFLNPLHWSHEGKYRFDSETALYGVLYTAVDVESTLLEVFGSVWLEARRISLGLLSRKRSPAMVDPAVANP
jgi:hypothetical protein